MLEAVTQGTGRPAHGAVGVWPSNKHIRLVGQSSFQLDSPCAWTETESEAGQDRISLPYGQRENSPSILKIAGKAETCRTGPS